MGLGSILRGLYVFGGERELASRLNLTLAARGGAEPDDEPDLPLPDQEDLPSEPAEVESRPTVN